MKKLLLGLLILGNFSAFSGVELREQVYSNDSDVANILYGNVDNLEDTSCLKRLLNSKGTKVNIAMGSRITSIRVEEGPEAFKIRPNFSAYFSPFGTIAICNKK